MQEFKLQDYLKALEASESCSSCEKVPVPEFGKDTRYVFISYSRKDYKMVYADLARLYVSGVPFFYDGQLTAGENWEEEIRKRMKDSRCAGVIFYISENFFLSESIQKEISFAFQKADEDLQEKRLASFSVNLTGQLPSQIQKKAFDSLTPELADKPFARPAWRQKLADYFPDNVTYVPFKERSHPDRIIENIQLNFNITPRRKLFDFRGAMFCSGKGEIRFPSGAVYKGAFENGRFSGRGMLAYSGGIVYDGRWKNGEKDGWGKMTYPNGATYEGRWKNDRKNGKCIYTHPDGTVYDGYWKDDKRNGQGRLIRSDGAWYEGRWVNNQFDGQGTYSWRDGRKYQGRWKKGKKDGPGTLTFPDGTVQSGRFENDEFIAAEDDCCCVFGKKNV